MHISSKFWVIYVWHNFSSFSIVNIWKHTSCNNSSLMNLVCFAPHSFPSTFSTGNTAFQTHWSCNLILPLWSSHTFCLIWTCISSSYHYCWSVHVHTVIKNNSSHLINWSTFFFFTHFFFSFSFGNSSKLHHTACVHLIFLSTIQYCSSWY